MRYLFDDGVFQCRADFFAPGARKNAEDHYLSIAERKYTERQRVKIRKHFTNLMHGFNDFVKFVEE